MGPYCKSCFCTTIEKRVRKELRAKFQLKAHEKIVVINDNTKEAVVSEYILNSISKKIPLQIEVVSDTSKLPDDARIIIPTSATKISAEFLKHVMLKDQLSVKKEEEIPLLESVNEEEIVTFAQFKNLTYRVQEQTKFESIVNKIEEQYPASSLGIVKSKKVLEKN